MVADERLQERDELINSLMGSLPVLRASMGISQGDLAEFVGISRQTYCSLELGKRKMSWNTFLSLFLFFISNEATNAMLKTKKGFISQVYTFLQYESNKSNAQYPQGIENKQNSDRSV